jgi:ketosteroid isomerase-like protein
MVTGRRPGEGLVKAALGAVLALVALAPAGRAADGLEALEARVRAREQAFAKSMADRDAAAFASFVSEEAVFFGQQPLRGRGAVAAGWQRYFEGAKAPFSWAPEHVFVIGSGTLALSTGPVFAPDGARVGTFNSTWRLEKDGEWRVVLDNGCPPCRCGEPGAAKP